ncbi:MAG: Guanosine-5-triphosphate,3-diphosphate pyrophosphatase [Verrucomicrobiota bacterium]|jgi:exopolyphosphatase/guanosine-5'-triphosphate,3'-diphosphate pyrophosphatase
MAIPPRVAVIDIGSNSIKMLVVARAATGQYRVLKNRTLDARIGAGISETEPKLSEAGMTRGLGAVRELVSEVAEFGVRRTILVATSAVRDASNGATFCQRVKTATKQDIRILSGKEEASYIGRGLTCDPELEELQDFYVFDLGGGSLECLSFKQRKVEQELSLQLGCVRLTEKFIKDPGAPLVQAELAALAAHATAELKQSGFKFAETPPTAVFTGGSMSTVRAILGAQQQQKMEDADPLISVETIGGMLDYLAPMSLDQRKAIPGLPSARADVFPAAIVTMLAVANAARIPSFVHSVYNLRWGLAAEALDQM